MTNTCQIPSGDLERLVAACADGDQSAFRRLYELQSPRLYGLALRMTGDHGRAADTLHDVMLQVWQRASRYDATLGPAEAWLVGLVRYRSLDMLRAYGRGQPTLVGDTEAAATDPDPLQRLAASDDAARLHRCLDTLDAPYRRVVMLSFLDGLSHSVLAERLNVPLGTVKSWIRRGLSHLRKCFEG